MVKNWDIAVVAVGMIVGFAIVLMNFTGMWPCNIIQSKYVVALTDHVNLNAAVSSFTDYVSSNAAVSHAIGDIHYWLTYPFRCS